MSQRCRAVHPSEFRRQIVEPHHAGRPIPDLAREFEPSVETVAAWVRQAGADAGRRADPPSSAKGVELGRLRRENQRPR